MAETNEPRPRADGGDDVVLSVVIPCLNAAETLAVQLEALSRQEWSEPWEVVLVDNGSTDGSVAIAERYRDRLRLRVVDASDERSNPHAMNVGARAARGALLAICDADDEAAPGWVAGIGSALREHELVAGRHENRKLNPSWVARALAPVQEDGLQGYDEWPTMPHAGSGNLGIRRATFERLGGFDETMRSLADTDLCWRAQLAGVPLVFAPDAVMHVRRRTTLTGNYRQGRSFGEYSVLLYRKFRPLGMPPLGLRPLRRWAGLVVALARTVPQPAQRLPVWMWTLGWRVGRLRGSVRHRVAAF